MIVYIEDAFLQNFLLDTVLLHLAFFAARQTYKKKNLFFAAALGAVFAILFPLLTLPFWAAWLLKFSFAALMCLIPFGSIKRKKDVGRYAFICLLFYVCTFVLGGALLGIFQTNTNIWVVTGIALGFAVVLALLIKKIYQKRALHRFIYACIITYKQKSMRVLGYLDSGNLACKNAIPVCFVSPDVFYGLFGDEILYKQAGQVCDEIVFQTLSGEKRSVAVQAEISMEISGKTTPKKQAYFALSTNMLNREYAALLNGALLEKDG